MSLINEKLPITDPVMGSFFILIHAENKFRRV